MAELRVRVPGERHAEVTAEVGKRFMIVPFDAAAAAEFAKLWQRRKAAKEAEKRPRTPLSRLTDKERRFAELWIADPEHNGTAAARGAGYKGSTNVLAVTATHNLGTPRSNLYKKLEHYGISQEKDG